MKKKNKVKQVRFVEGMEINLKVTEVACLNIHVFFMWTLNM